MTHAEFIYPAYALTVAGLLGVTLWSYVAMRRAEGVAPAEPRRAEAAVERATAPERRR